MFGTQEYLRDRNIENIFFSYLQWSRRFWDSELQPTICLCYIIQESSNGSNVQHYFDQIQPRRCALVFFRIRNVTFLDWIGFIPWFEMSFILEEIFELGMNQVSNQFDVCNAFNAYLLRLVLIEYLIFRLFFRSGRIQQNITFKIEGFNIKPKFFTHKNT